MELQDPKSLLIVSSATLAVLVSLNSSSNNNYHSRVFLAITLVANTLNILFSSISLYENKAMSSELTNIAHGNLLSHIQNPNTDSISSKQYAPRKPLFVFCEKASYISFLLFIMGLTTYAIYKLFSA